MGEKILEFLSKKKTLLFLIMCLAVHVFNAVLFYFLGLPPFAVLNVCSSVFYAVILLTFKKNTDFYVIFTYFEIITFSLVSEIFSGGEFLYIFYVVGMVSAIFYLLPHKARMKHIFQGIGIAYALAIYFVRLKRICIFPEYASAVASCKTGIGFLNLCITLFTLFYISNLYFFELNAARERLTYCSNHDLLTGLFNRRFFEHIMKRNKSEHENKYSIAIFDIDDFKKVNDTYGHQAGDLVIKTVSNLIEKASKSEYVPVRWGGEEFILYMPSTDEDKAFSHLENICKKIRGTTVKFGSMKIKVTVTVGMCTGTDLSDYQSVIRQADEKLYEGKRSGKNRVVR